MKIQYIGNTCDVKGLSKWGGEIMLMIKDGDVVAHHDYSDDALDLDYVSPLLKPYGINVEFDPITDPSKKLLKACQDYMEKHYGLPEWNDE